MLRGASRTSSNAAASGCTAHDSFLRHRDLRALFDGPEPGQLVEVRRRHWIVSETGCVGGLPRLPKRNLVELVSIDEDALGEEIEVLWDLERGAHGIERAGLPRLSALDAPSETLELLRMRDFGDVDVMTVKNRRATTDLADAGGTADGLVGIYPTTDGTTALRSDLSEAP